MEDDENQQNYNKIFQRENINGQVSSSAKITDESERSEQAQHASIKTHEDIPEHDYTPLLRPGFEQQDQEIASSYGACLNPGQTWHSKDNVKPKRYTSRRPAARYSPSCNCNCDRFMTCCLELCCSCILGILLGAFRN